MFGTKRGSFISNSGKNTMKMGIVPCAMLPVAVIALLAPVQFVRAEESACSMTPSELFGDFLPYDGLTAIWIRPDGLIIIEGGNDKGAAFRANVVGLKLVEQNDKVTFKTSAGGGTVLHSFVDVGTQGCSSCQAAYYIPGDATISYDEENCRLSVFVDGAKRDFEAVFDFSDAQTPTPLEPEINICGPNCSAVAPQTCCYAPPGCCKTCPANSDCMCWPYMRDGVQLCKCTYHCHVVTAKDAAIPAEAQPQP